MTARPGKQILLGGPQRRAAKRQGTTARRSLFDDVRRYQSELEIQNKALRFSQGAAEAAYERFVTLFSHVPLALMVVDERGQIAQNNARALALLRPLESDPPLTYFAPLVAATDASKVHDGFLQALHQGTAELSEISLRAGADRWITGDLHVARLDHDDQRGVEFICAIVDQSTLLMQRSALQAGADALQQRHSQLQQSRGQLAAIIDASLDAIIATDDGQRITVYNPAAQTLFGYPPDQALGKPVTQLLPDLVVALGQAPTGSPQHLGEMTARNCRGEAVCVDVRVALEHQANGRVATLFVHDLTATKASEAQHTALEAQLREAQKMQAIGTLAGGIAHDFNNIIGAILGNLTLAQQDAQLNPQAMTSLREIEKAGRRARDLVRQILTFSRNEKPHRVPLYLADVVQEAVRLFRVGLPPNVTLETATDKALPLIMADATQIEQVLFNLLTNAMHAIGTRPGRIRVALTVDKRAPDVGSSTLDKDVVLSVTDTGCGIDAALQERIFEPFFTTKPVGQGTGLGLSVVHGIVQTHGGRVEVDSQPGRGTCFVLYFPPTPVTASARPTVVPTSTRAAGRGQRVMVVDDDETQLFLVRRVLSRKGYQVLAFSDPKQAVQLFAQDSMFAQDPNQCDALITDFNMPGFSGVDLLRSVRKLRPALPMALASGYITPEIERDALAAGARLLIHKPNDVAELCDAVARLLELPPT